MPQVQLDKEALVGHILIELGMNMTKYAESVKKTLALERYMRAYLRSLTLVELEFELKWLEDNRQPSVTLVGPLVTASSGYDAFMAKRRRVAV